MGKIPNITLLTISKELFVETMNILHEQYKHNRKCSEAFGVILPDTMVCYTGGEKVETQLIKILKLAMVDNIKHSWIEYFIYELEFGAKYRKGCASRKDGSFIDLTDSSKLYDYLIEDN